MSVTCHASVYNLKNKRAMRVPPWRCGRVDSGNVSSHLCIININGKFLLKGQGLLWTKTVYHRQPGYASHYNSGVKAVTSPTLVQSVQPMLVCTFMHEGVTRVMPIQTVGMLNTHSTRTTMPPAESYTATVSGQHGWLLRWRHPSTLHMQTRAECGGVFHGFLCQCIKALSFVGKQSYGRIFKLRGGVFFDEWIVVIAAASSSTG